MSSAGAKHAGLMDVRVLPDFHRQGVAAYTMNEMLRFLARDHNVHHIEAHIVEVITNNRAMELAMYLCGCVR
jgi:GNAT superfamily N-acetyltransferase